MEALFRSSVRSLGYSNGVAAISCSRVRPRQKDGRNLATRSSPEDAVPPDVTSWYRLFKNCEASYEIGAGRATYFQHHESDRFNNQSGLSQFRFANSNQQLR